MLPRTRSHPDLKYTIALLCDKNVTKSTDPDSMPFTEKYKFSVDIPSDRVGILLSAFSGKAECHGRLMRNNRLGTQTVDTKVIGSADDMDLFPLCDQQDGPAYQQIIAQRAQCCYRFQFQILHMIPPPNSPAASRMNLDLLHFLPCLDLAQEICR